MKAPAIAVGDYAATLDEVAAELGVSRGRALEIQERGLASLRKRVEKYGLAPGDPALMSREERDAYCPRAVCVDCGETTGDGRIRRCPACRSYEVARRDGYSEGTYSARAFASRALYILRRWPGTTT